jgi:hypothetical protein
MTFDNFHAVKIANDAVDLFRCACIRSLWPVLERVPASRRDGQNSTVVCTVTTAAGLRSGLAPGLGA